MKNKNINNVEKAYDFTFVFILPLLLTFYENYRWHWYDNTLKFLVSYFIGIIVFYMVNRIIKYLFFRIVKKYCKKE